MAKGLILFIVIIVVTSFVISFPIIDFISDIVNADGKNSLKDFMTVFITSPDTYELFRNFINSIAGWFMIFMILFCIIYLGLDYCKEHYIK